jgi:phosphatidylglycerol:prolipoprotein diacylglycerol transferase
MMSLLAEISFPNIDPVIFSIGPISVRWYGVAFVCGFLIGNELLRRLAVEKRLPVPPETAGDVMIASLIGIVLGGRLGYVLFYDLPKFVNQPEQILQVWKGGLSFHGGLLGCAVAMFIFSKRRKVKMSALADACVVSATPGIFLVRCANFINGELWGRETDVAWAMRFPTGGDVLRHPSQLYEGVLEGLLLFALLWGFRKRSWLLPRGAPTAAFLLGYGIIRFFIEFVREPDPQLGEVLWVFSMGQLLCMAMILSGAFVWYWTLSHHRSHSVKTAEPAADQP